MTKRGGKRHSPEQIVQKLRDGDAMLGSGQDVVGVSEMRARWSSYAIQWGASGTEPISLWAAGPEPYRERETSD